MRTGTEFISEISDVTISHLSISTSFDFHPVDFVLKER